MRSRSRKSSLGRGVAVLLAALSLCAAAQGATEYKALHNFTGADGSGPWGGVTFERSGALYGTTPSGGNIYGTTTRGGTFNYGTAFELTRRSGGWAETVLYSFCGESCGAEPYAGLTMDAIKQPFFCKLGQG